MENTSNEGVVKDLHYDLARKYRVHGSKVEQIWPSLSQAQRTEVMKAGAADGVVLKHSSDISLGNVYKLIPEWNLRDVTAPQSDFFLHLLKHRATTSLTEQYTCGVDGSPGDYELITEMMRTKNLRHVEDFTDCYTFFLEGDMYGKSVELVKEKESSLKEFMPAIRARVCVPQEVGEFILMRQMYMLQSLNIIIDDILEEGSTTRNQKPHPKKPTDVATAALSKLTIQPAPPKLDLSDLHASAVDQKAVLDDGLHLLCTEPVVLAHSVNHWYFSRPELVADEKGRMLPALTDKYISAAVLEAVHSTVKGAAIWDYMCRLLELLKGFTNKSHRAIILQEIANLCHLEYTRAQSLLKRHVAIDTGTKWFKRISNAYDNGIARITMKGDPTLLIRENPQLYYLLRLCQPDTNAAKAVDWIKKLDDLHKAHPLEREALGDRQGDALCDLAVIISFIHYLSPTISMPSFNRKKGQLFVARSAQLDIEINKMKNEVDLADFAIPIDNLLEPGMAESALARLDDFIVEKAGTKMGFLYQDMIDECILRLQEQLEAKTKEQAKTEYVSLPPETPQTPEVVVQQRRQKEKTRPTHSSIYEINPSKQTSVTEQSDLAQQSEQFKVKPSTAEVFTTLFSRSEARGSVSWARFESAMGDLGFSVTPNFGSVYAFKPPQTMALERPFTFHRPHKPNIEGYRLLTLARRLKRVYGWSEQTFQVA